MLREDTETKEEHDKVTLSTMHAAKGLEFRYVFLVGLEEGLLPHQRVLDERASDAVGMAPEVDEVEQERRLFYVAVTRAKEELFLCHAQMRPARGKMAKRLPSRFLLAIPDELLEKQSMLAPPAPSSRQLHQGASEVLAALMRSS